MKDLLPTAVIISSLLAGLAHAADPIRDCAACPEMVVVSAGSFQMGGSARDPAAASAFLGRTTPVHAVEIGQPFAMSRTEITVDQYAAFVEASGRTDGPSCYGRDATGARADLAGASWRSPGFDQSGDHPAVCVSFDDVTAYTAWLSERTGETYRLPTEAEWEYAARAGTETDWYWGEDPAEACAFANVPDTYPCDDGYADTAPVASFRANAFGLHDMLGNVWEWVSDCWHPNYDGAPTDGAAWTADADCAIRTVRGQGFAASNTQMSAAARSADPVGYRGIGLGFRVVRELGQTEAR